MCFGGSLPPLVPVPLPSVDRFGLRIPRGLLDLLTGTDRDAVGKLVTEVFAAAALRLGEEEARRLFKKLSRRPRRGRGPNKNHRPDRDTKLLDVYDQAVLSGGLTIPELSTILHDRWKSQFGATPLAIEKQIRRLIETRKRRDAELQQRRKREDAEFQQWRENHKAQFGDYPRSLLDAISENQGPTADK
jgi:hypothetical protein